MRSRARFLRLASLMGAAMFGAMSLSGCITLEFSPDGSRIAATWVNGDRNVLATMNADGSGFQMVPMTDEALAGTWSPDGGKLAYSLDTGLHVYDLESRKVRRIIGGYVKHSLWTDRDTIVVLRNAAPIGQPEAFEFQWISASTGTIGARVPASGSKDIRRAFPIRRTNGLVYFSGDDIYVAEFGEDRRITTTGDVVGISLRPGSDKLVFARRSNNAQFILLSLYEYDLNLRSVKKLEFPNHVPGINPKPRTGPNRVDMVWFSPDHRLMAIVGSTAPAKPDAKSKSTTALYVTDLTGKTGKQITNPTNEPEIAWAAWSPDGSTLAYYSGTDSELRLKSVNVETGARRQLRTASAKKP